MRTLLLLTFCLVIAPAGLAGAQTSASDPVEVTRRTVNEVLEDMRRNQAVYTADRDRLDAMIRERLLPHFDFEVMTRLAAGRYWRQADDAQQDALVEAFSTLLIRTYTNILQSNLEKTTEVAESAKINQDYAMSNDDALVSARITSPSGEPVALLVRLRQDEGEWKVIDVSANGISLMVTYRGDFSREISRGGIAGLIETLRAKNRANAAE